MSSAQAFFDKARSQEVARSFALRLNFEDKPLPDRYVALVVGNTIRDEVPAYPQPEEPVQYWEDFLLKFESIEPTDHSTPKKSPIFSPHFIRYISTPRQIEYPVKVFAAPKELLRAAALLRVAPHNDYVQTFDIEQTIDSILASVSRASSTSYLAHARRRKDKLSSVLEALIGDYADADQTKVKAAVYIDAIAARPQDLARFPQITPAVVDVALAYSDELRPQSKNSLAAPFLTNLAVLTQQQVDDYVAALTDGNVPVPRTNDNTFYNRHFLGALQGMQQQQNQSNTLLAQSLAQTNTAVTALVARVEAIAAQPAAAANQLTAVDRVRIDANTIGQFKPASVPDSEACWEFIEAFQSVATKYGADKVLAVINQCFTENSIARDWYRSLPPAHRNNINTSLDTLKTLLKAHFCLPRHRLLRLAEEERYSFAQKRSVMDYIYKKAKLFRMVTDDVPRTVEGGVTNASIVAAIHSGIEEPVLKLMLESLAATPTVTVEAYAAQASMLYDSCRAQQEQVQQMVSLLNKSTRKTSSGNAWVRDYSKPTPTYTKNYAGKDDTPLKDGAWRLGTKVMRACRFCKGAHLDRSCPKAPDKRDGTTREAKEKSTDLVTKGYFGASVGYDDDQCIAEMDSEEELDSEFDIGYDYSCVSPAPVIPAFHATVSDAPDDDDDDTTTDEEDSTEDPPSLEEESPSRNQCYGCRKRFSSRVRLIRHLNQTQFHGQGITARKIVASDSAPSDSSVIKSDNPEPLLDHGFFRHAEIQVRCYETGDTAPAVVDTGYGSSATDELFLTSLPDEVERVKLDSPRWVQGMTGGLEAVTEVVRLPIYIPAVNHQTAFFYAWFHVFKDIGGRLLFGQDTIHAQRIDVYHDNKIIIGSCNNLTVRTANRVKTPADPSPTIIRVARDVVLPAHHVVCVPIKRFTSSVELGDMEFTPIGEPMRQGWGCPPNALRRDQEGVWVTNFRARPLKLRAGRRLGTAVQREKGYFGDDDVLDNSQALVPLPAPPGPVATVPDLPGPDPPRSTVAEPAQSEVPPPEPPPADGYLPNYTYPLPDGVRIGNDSTCTVQDVDVNTTQDITEEQAEALKAKILYYRRAFNDVPGMVREPEEDYMRIPIPADLEATLKQKPPYNVSTASRANIDKVFDLNTVYGRMESAKSSPFSLQVFCAGNRPVVDMRPLNAITIGLKIDLRVEYHLRGKVPYIPRGFGTMLVCR
ncbi:hypothetical protein BJ508DRAFT_315351, partial [Ascobolus immersus RN42]